MVVGTYSGDIFFGNKLHMHHGEWDAFVLTLSPTGNPVWSCSFGETLPHFAYAVAVANTGQIAVAGAFRGEMQIEPNILTAPDFEEDAYIVVFTETGGVDWARSYGGPGLQIASGLKFQGDNLLVSGTFRNSIHFGNGVSLVTSLGASYVAALGRVTGTGIWAHSPGAANLYGLRDVVDVLPNGDVVAAVGVAEVVQVVGGKYELSPDRVDLLVTRLHAADGTPIWWQKYGDAPNAQEPSGLAAGGNGTLAIVGHFAGTLDFGQSPFVTLGARDGFLVRPHGGRRPLLESSDVG